MSARRAGWRLLVAAALLAGLAACGGRPEALENAGPAYSVTETASYLVTQRLVLENRGTGWPEKQNLWLAVLQDREPGQRVERLGLEPAGYEEVVDEYGNRYAEFDLAEMGPGEQVVIEARYRVTVSGLAYALGDCQGALPAEETEAELHVESRNPQIVALADGLATGRQTACEQVRAFYDYIGANLTYTYNGTDWGAQAALGPMGADCSEYASLLVALARARGIPARYLEGLNVAAERPAGARLEHAWVEVYLPGVGWAPVDPTLGQSPTGRERYFAALPADHMVVTMGRNPSTLRGASYWTHLYWPGDSTEIVVRDEGWQVSSPDEGF